MDASSNHSRDLRMTMEHAVETRGYLTRENRFEDVDDSLLISPRKATDRPGKMSESVSSALDEIVYERASTKSDPIGREHDLSSSGPLDDGMQPVASTLRIPPQSERVHKFKSFGCRHPSNGPASAAYDISDRAGSRTPVKQYSCGTGAPTSSPQASSLINGYDGRSPTKCKSMRSGVVQNGHLSPIQTQWRGDDPRSLNNGETVEASLAGSALPSAYAPLNRRNARSHTSQGIPNHNLRSLVLKPGDILEEPSRALESQTQDIEMIQAELSAYKDRVTHLEEQLAMLSAQYKEALSTMRSSRPSGQPHSVQEYWASELAHSPGTTVGSTPSLTTSPDAFSPYVSATPGVQQNIFRGGFGGMTQGTASNLARASVQGGVDALGSGSNLSVGEPYVMAGLRLNFASLVTSNPQSPVENQGTGEGSQDKLTYPLFASSALYDGRSRGAVPHLALSGALTVADEGGLRGSCPDDQISADVLVSRAMGLRNQEASITLQQQLKSATPARKAAIVRAIEPHVLKLSDDKHGNFLVQRAIGVDTQLAMRLQGQFVTLALSQFGCHVVQRLLDEEESLRKMVIEELLSTNVYETLTCRNSIHIWQKVLELQWHGNNKMRAWIYRVVNATMKNKWAETAMLETGSIICQNIFESASEVEKADCLNEILGRLCECACNQWGVWVVQHIIEHGEPTVKRRAFEQLLQGAARLTLSQYGQKAIMSSLKSRDAEFISKYINILCDREVTTDTTAGHNVTTMSSSNGNRRSLLVDVSTAPQGVQIVTQLLTSVTPEQRERIIKTVRKNSVFLKGSKAGLRVHQLCGG